MLSADSIIMCHGDCHVWLGSSSLCTCEAEKVAMMFPPNVTVAPFSGYHPAGYRPPKPDPAPDVSLSQLRAALRAGASWLSADGKFAYCERYGAVLKAEWDGANFGVWWPVEGGKMPEDAVKL